MLGFATPTRSVAIVRGEYIPLSDLWKIKANTEKCFLLRLKHDPRWFIWELKSRDFLCLIISFISQRAVLEFLMFYISLETFIYIKNEQDLGVTYCKDLV